VVEGVPVARWSRRPPSMTLSTALVIRTHITTLHAACRPIIGTKGHSQVPIATPYRK
jgi:hypothetical protein